MEYEKTFNNENAVIPNEDASSEVSHEITLYAEPIAHIGNFPVTNALLTSTVAVFLIIVGAVVLRARMREVPRGFQNACEAVLDGALSLCDQVTGSRTVSEKVFPLAFSVFAFVIVNNWLGLLPLGGLGLVESGEHGAAFVPFLRGGTADLNTTLALALMAVIGANLFGIASIGFWKVFNKYVNLEALGSAVVRARKDPAVLIVAPVTFFVGLLELIGEFAKVASLSFRLFGNIFAGEVLLAAMAAIFAYALPLPFLFLEIFVGAIQALIFSILLLVYFAIAAADHGEHGSESKPAHA